MTVGAPLPTLDVAPITPVQVAFMVVANNDTAAIHVDERAAHAAGLPGVVLPGSFVLGHIGRMLEQLVGFAGIRALDIQFRAPVFLGDGLSVGGTVLSASPGALYSLELWVRNTAGKTVATGTAQVQRSE